MQFWKRLFGSRTSKSKVRQEDAIFAKIHEFLTNEDVQNASLPAEVRSIIEAGETVDEVAGATGEFGRHQLNPIPVNGAIGEVTYLSSLVSAHGAFVFSHRLGAIGRVDVFELVTADGSQWDVLFFDPYHARRSRKAPTGYKFRPRREAPVIYCTNKHVTDFPQGIADAISAWTNEVLGGRMVSRDVRAALRERRFIRPVDHAIGIDQLPIQRPYARKQIQGVLLRKHLDKAVEGMQNVVQKFVSFDLVERHEALYFCAAVSAYCYIKFGECDPDVEMLDEFNRSVLSDSEKETLTYSESSDAYQLRYSEYSNLLNSYFEDGGHAAPTARLADKAARTICGIALRDRPLVEAVMIATVSAIIGDSVAMAKRLRRPIPMGVIEAARLSAKNAGSPP